MDFVLKFLGLGTVALVARLLLVATVMSAWLYLVSLVLPYIQSMFDALSETLPEIGPFTVPIYDMLAWIGLIDAFAIILATHATLVTLRLAIYVEESLRGIGG